MAYCSNCGEKLPKDADFCPRCGTKTMRAPGATAASGTSEEMQQAFAKMSAELEKAFTLAAKEIQTAFQTARENMQESTMKEPVVCGSCNEKNPGDSVYCYKCGKKMEAEGKEKKT